MLLNSSNIVTESIRDELFDEKKVSVSILRLDKLHQVVSGNKVFKLHFFLEKAAMQSNSGVVTFGGAYSNHLVATAYACKGAGLQCIGIIRGEAAPSLSRTLQDCLTYGMQLKFIQRSEYENKDKPGFVNDIKQAYNNFLIIPEGGYHPLGAAGAALIMDSVIPGTSHICCAIGTATTATGLLSRLKKSQQVVGVTVLKNMDDISDRIRFLSGNTLDAQRLTLLGGYHFGGYARKSKELLAFMNDIYRKHQLPTDFVYTGKLMYGVMDSIKKDFFPKGSNITCIHSGGLQGNRSLPAGTLDF